MIVREIFSQEPVDIPKMFGKFLPIAMKVLKISKLPKIQLEAHIEDDEQPTFGRYVNDEIAIHLALSDRHPVDILRTLAHELVHFKQHTEGRLGPNSGETGSPEENQAHEVAGVIMRHFNKMYPVYLKSKPLAFEHNKKINERRRKKIKKAAYGPGLYGGYGYYAGYSGDSGGGDSGGMAEGVNDYLWHGSKSKHEILYPQQAKDTGGKEESNKNAVYATPSAKVAIAMGLTTPGSDTGMFPNDPQMVLFKGKIRKGEMVYLHKVPKDLFIKHNSREWYSKPDVKEIKPIGIKEVPVDKYLHLIRQATPKDLELRNKYTNQNTNEFAPAGFGGDKPPRGPKNKGRDPWDDDNSGEDPYSRPDPRYYERSIDYFGRFEADHFDDEVFDKKSGVFKGYWDDDEGRVQIAYFKFDDPEQTGSDDPGMGWYYEPQNEDVQEGDLIPWPKGTVKVDVSDVYDWYKLGQHISNLKGLGKHDFGKGPPQTVLSFGSEPLEHEYLKYLKKIGLTTHDIDENFADGKNPGRKGLAKRSGVNCKASVSTLRNVAKNSSGEKQRMAHWCANMKSGRKK